jgi:hypothetical protein
MKSVASLSLAIMLGSHMNAVIERIYPDQDMLNRLTEFHGYTSSSRKDKPDISQFQGNGRKFVAKMHSLISNSYFSFETNDDVDELIKAATPERFWKLNWYYYDERGERIDDLIEKTKKYDEIPKIYSLK